MPGYEKNRDRIIVTVANASDSIESARAASSEAYPKPSNFGIAFCHESGSLLVHRANILQLITRQSIPQIANSAAIDAKYNVHVILQPANDDV